MEQHPWVIIQYIFRWLNYSWLAALEATLTPRKSGALRFVAKFPAKG